MKKVTKIASVEREKSRVFARFTQSVFFGIFLRKEKVERPYIKHSKTRKKMRSSYPFLTS